MSEPAGRAAAGGSSWTPEWLKFDNTYFTEVKSESDPDLLVLPTDKAVFQDESFRCAVHSCYVPHQCSGHAPVLGNPNQKCIFGQTLVRERTERLHTPAQAIRREVCQEPG